MHRNLSNSILSLASQFCISILILFCCKTRSVQHYNMHPIKSSQSQCWIWRAVDIRRKQVLQKRCLRQIKGLQSCRVPLLSGNPGERGTKGKYRPGSNFPSGSTNQPKCLNSLSNNTFRRITKSRGRKHALNEISILIFPPKLKKTGNSFHCCLSSPSEPDF